MKLLNAQANTRRLLGDVPAVTVALQMPANFASSRNRTNSESSSRLVHRALLTMLLLCLATTQAVADDDLFKGEVDQFSNRLSAITRHPDSSSRIDAITQLLDKLPVTYHVDTFKTDTHEGRNLVVDFETESETQIVVAAHYDQVPVGNGAVDNAGSCGLLVELCERFHQSPLKNADLRIVFFDLEELGLLGSKDYVEKIRSKNIKRPDFVINVDIFGYGDSAWLVSDAPDGRLASAFRGSFESSGFPVSVSPVKKYPPSDHVPFASFGIPTIGLALIDQSEISQVQRVLRGERGKLPKILKTIHTPSDTAEMVHPTQCAKAIPLVEKAIRELDQ